MAQSRAVAMQVMRWISLWYILKVGPTGLLMFQMWSVRGEGLSRMPPSFLGLNTGSMAMPSCEASTVFGGGKPEVQLWLC